MSCQDVEPYNTEIPTESQQGKDLGKQSGMCNVLQKFTKPSFDVILCSTTILSASCVEHFQPAKIMIVRLLLNDYTMSL